MRRGFSASLLKRPNVDAARLLDCAPSNSLDNYELPLELWTKVGDGVKG